MIKLSGDQANGNEDDQKVITPEEIETLVPAEVQVLKKRFRLGHAPEGVCNAGIMVDGDTEQVELIDGIFEFPDDWDADDVQNWSDALISAGFEDISYYEHQVDLDVTVNEKKKEEEDQKDVVYSLAHPDYFGKEDVEMNIPTPTDEDPEHVTVIQLEQGVFKTDDMEFAEILKSFGFIDLEK